MGSLLDELEDILGEYADEDNYSQTTRTLPYISNRRGEETFYEFSGDAAGAKRGLEIIKKWKEIL